MLLQRLVAIRPLKELADKHYSEVLRVAAKHADWDASDLRIYILQGADGGEATYIAPFDPLLREGDLVSIHGRWEHAQQTLTSGVDAQPFELHFAERLRRA